MKYEDQLRTSAWLQRKYDILYRDNFVCSICLCDNYERQLHVHHVTYQKGLKAWQYPDYLLVTLCSECHEKEHKEKAIYNPKRIYEWIRKLLTPQK